jgi:hypothetical protein
MVDTRPSITKAQSLFGISALVGARKIPPLVTPKLLKDDQYVSSRGGLQMADVINVVDVDHNDELQPDDFTYNANGNKGMDFIYIPEQHSL